MEPGGRVAYSDLERISGHNYLYRNSRSQKIHYKRGAVKFSTHTTKILEAKRFVELELARRKDPSTIKATKRRLSGVRNPLLAPLWEEFLDQKRAEVTESTMKTYEQNWNFGLKDFWGEKTTLDVTDASVAQFKMHYLEHNPKRVCHHTVVHLKSWFQFLRSRRLISELPDMATFNGMGDIIDRNARREKVGRVYTTDEMNSLFDACGQLRPDLAARAYLGISLGGKAGLRKSEVLKLRWENVNLKLNIMRIWSLKNHKWREVPLVGDLAAYLEFSYEGRVKGSPWLFPMSTDPMRPISSQLFDKSWVDVKRIAKIRGRARFHDLRHTFATMTAEAGWPPIVACDVLDQSLRIYQRVYCKPSFEKKTEMMTKLFPKKEDT